jgi:DNA-binding GntR family transcriptional regulator
LLTRIPTSRAVEDSADPHGLLLQALERRDPIAARRALERDLTQSTERVMSELARQKAIRE